MRNDCKVFCFCRSKCHKTFKAKLNPRKLKWTKAHRRAAGKEMSVDTSFDFERLRHRPVKYDRELMKTTVRTLPYCMRRRFHRIASMHVCRVLIAPRACRAPQVRAMDRVAKIKQTREERFWQKRMEPNKQLEKERDAAEVGQGLDLIISPLAQLETQKVVKKAKQKVAEKA